MMIKFASQITQTTRVTPYLLQIAILLCCVTQNVSARSPGQDALDMGTQLYKKAQYENARILFLQATEQDPGLIRAWENLGWSHYQLNDFDSALQYWDLVLKIEPDNISLINASGKIYVQQDKYERAIERFQKSLSLKSEQTNIHLQLGDIFARQGDLDKAKRQYQQATQSSQLSESAALRLVNVLERSNRRKQAIQFLVNIQHQQELTPLLSQSLARLYARNAEKLYSRKKYSKAATYYGKAIALDPDEDEYRINLGWSLRRQNKLSLAIDVWLKVVNKNPDKFELFRSIGDAYYESGNKTAAQKWYKRSAESGSNSAGVLLRLADDSLENKKADEALVWFNRLADKNKLEKNWWYRIANSFQRHHFFDEGIKFLEGRVVVNNSREKIVKLALSRLYAARGSHAFQGNQLQNAISDLEKALHYNANNNAAQRDIGWTYWKLERWDRVEKHWKQYLSISQDKTIGYNLLTQLYLRNRQPELAIEYVDKSLKLNSNQPVLELRKAKALLMANRFSESRKIAEKLAFNNPESIPIQFFWGGILLKYQDFKRARQQWKNVLLLDENNPRAFFNYIKSYYESGEYDFAVDEAKRFLKLNGPHPLMIKLLAQDAYLRENDKDINYWRTALVNLEPEVPQHWLSLAQHYYSMYRFSNAIDTLNHALTVHPENIELLLSLADTYRAAGNTRNAIENYRSIAQRNPGNRRAYLGLFYSLMEEEKFDEAMGLLENNRRGFLKDYEVAMETANILATKTGSLDALKVFDQVVPLDRSVKTVPILVYHGLSDHARSMDLSVDLFNDQLHALKRAGYTALTVSQLDKMRRGILPFPELPIVITFDDARRNAFEHGDPVLERHGMNATMFVPTARILDNHPYFADWQTLRRYQSSGRWDMQSHGHHAHDPLPLDREGNTGSFLVNRAWLTEQARFETRQEYTHRISLDHEQSMNLLANKISGVEVIAYAFPFSEAGQQSAGNEPSAYETNELLSQNYFTYSFVQDRSGYNILHIGDKSPLLLRRFTVPRNWNGKKLLQHLANLNPYNAARIAKGKTLYWQGRPSLARNIFLDLDLKEPDLAEKSKYLLASTSYTLNLTRDANRYFSEFEQVKPDLSQNELHLKNRIQWDTKPRFGIETGSRLDSDEREQSWYLANFTYSWSRPVDIWLTGGNKTLSQTGFPNMDIQQGGIGMRAQFSPEVTVETQALVEKPVITSSDSLVADSVTGNLDMRYRSDLLRFQLGISRANVESIPAYLQEIVANSISSYIELRPSRRLSTSLFVRRNDYTDENYRNDARAAVSYRIYAENNNWHVGLDTAYYDTGFESEFYYTPAELNVSRLFMKLSTNQNSRFPLSGMISIGNAEDKSHAKQTITNAELNFTQHWNSYFKTGLSANHYEAPSYRSSQLDMSLQIRF